MIDRVAARLTGLKPWPRRGTALGLGLCSAAAFPPLYLVPLMMVGYAGLMMLLDGTKTKKGAFGLGWWFGIGHFGAGLYWIAHAFLIYPDQHAWMIPFALAGLGMGMGLFAGLAALIYRLLWSASPWRVLGFAGAWTFVEWLRGWIFTGLPWNLSGYVWAFSDAMLQVTALLGIHGLSLITVAALASPAVGRGYRPVLWAVGALAVVWAGGALRLSQAEEKTVPGVVLRLVQANIGQAEKWLPHLREEHFEKQVAMSRGPGFEKVTHVIWPETSAFYSLDIDTYHRNRIATAAPPGGLVLAGAPRVTPRGVQPLQVWNSFFVVTDKAEIVGIYDKAHLVPFGEYVPLKEWSPLKKMTAGATDFSAGPGVRTLDLPGLPPVSPLICYEVIFPGAVIAKSEKRPGWLLNLTNDAWYGFSAGPFQHFAITRVRAIEEGLPIVRAAGTGISAIVDSYGRTIAEIELGGEGIVDGPLPAALEQVTPFGRFGSLPALLLIFCCLILALRLRSYSEK